MSQFQQVQTLRKIELQLIAENPAVQEILKKWVVDDGVVCKREFSKQERKAAAKTGEAMPDGSYPIGNAEDLHNAISLAHFSNHPESEVKGHIQRRAKALGLEKELPMSWGGKNKSKKGKGVVKSDDYQGLVTQRGKSAFESQMVRKVEAEPVVEAEVQDMRG